MANDEVANYSMEPSGGSRLLGVNQLQSGLDKLTTAITGLSAKLGGGGGWSGSGATFNSTGSFQTANGGGTNGGGPSFGTGGTLNGGSSGGNGGWGGGLSSALALGGAGMGILGLGKSLAASGGSILASNSNLGTYQAISNYRMQAGLGLANNGQAMNSLMNLAGYGNRRLSIASGAQDAGAGMATLLYNSGSYGGSLNARGTNMFTMSGGMGITTPGMTFADNAALTSQIYSPQMSMQMRMMGFGTTPLRMGGGQSTPAQLYQGMFQRWFGKGNVSQARLQSNFGSNGEITAQLAQMGITGSNAVAMQNSMLAYDKLRNRGMSVNQINNVFSGAATHNNWALTQLKNAGIDVNNITQLQKNATALSTQRAGGQEAAYQSGLAESTGLINEFNSALNTLLNGPLRGFTGALNYFKGFTGGMKGMPSGSGGAANNTSGSMGGGTSSSTSMVSGAAMSAVGFAKQEIGLPYVWGGSNPSMGGFDCSGLVQWAYKQAGVSLPRTSQAQWAALAGKHAVPLNKVQAGDLVFMAGSDGTNTAPGHVAMAISGNQLVQAEQTGTRIQITPYNPNAWLYAARPSGSGVSGSSNAGTGAPGASSASATGNSSGLMGAMYTDASLSSMSESNALAGGLLSGMLGNTGYAAGPTVTGAPGTSNAGGAAPGGSGGSPGNVQSYKGDVDQVLKMLGQPQTNDVTALKQMSTESGGQPTVVNKWDSNWKAGHPSVGLMQVIQGTFDAYAGPYKNVGPFSYGVSTDAMANIYAGLNYAIHRYGPMNWTNVLGHGHGYARGTQNLPPGVSIVGEQGMEAIYNRPGGGQTSVLTAGQTSGLLAAIQSGQMGPSGGGGINIPITIAQGAIQINGLGGGGAPPGTPGLAATDTQAIGQAISDAIEKAIEQSALMQKLAAGTS